MASIEKRKNKKGLVYKITVSHQGVRHSESYRPLATKPGAIRAEVLREAERYTAWVQSGGTSDCGLTLDEYITSRWKRDAKADLTPAQYEQYMSVLDRLIRPRLGRMKLESITQREIQALVDKMTTAGLKTASIKKYLCALRSVLAHAEYAGVLEADPMRHVRVPKMKKENRVHAWTPEQCRNFLQFLRTGYIQETRAGRHYKRTIDHKWYCFFLLSIYGSMRRGEIVALQWDDVDVENQKITIRRSVQRIRGEVIIKSPKTVAGIRTITLPAIVFEELKRLPHLGRWVITTGGTVSPGSMLYPTSPTKMFRMCLHAYNTANKKDPLPEITLHDLRHTGATLLLEHGIGIETVSRRLGHSRASVTLDVYGESLESIDRTAAEKLEMLLGGN